MTTQELLLGVASQVLVLETPRPIASVSAVTLYEAEQDDTGQPETAVSGAGTVDTFSTTTNAAAGPSQSDPRLISVTSSVGAVNGRRYFIHALGIGESFELARRNATDHDLTARHPLLNNYASGATVLGLRATIAVSDTWAAEKANLSTNDNPNARYRARWEVAYATIDGSTGESDVLYTNVDLVRYSSRPQVNPLDVENAYPNWLDRLGDDDRSTQGQYLIDEAIDLVRDDLHGRGVALRSIRSSATVRRLVVSRAVWLAAEANALAGAATPDQLTVAKDAYDRQVAAMVESPRLAQDKTGGGGIDTNRGNSGRRFVR